MRLQIIEGQLPPLLLGIACRRAVVLIRRPLQTDTRARHGNQLLVCPEVHATHDDAPRVVPHIIAHSLDLQIVVQGERGREDTYSIDFHRHTVPHSEGQLPGEGGYHPLHVSRRKRAALADAFRQIVGRNLSFHLHPGVQFPFPGLPHIRHFLHSVLSHNSFYSL